MRIYIKFILPFIILLFNSNLIGQTIVEGSEESKSIKQDSNWVLYYYKGELLNGDILSYYENGKLRSEGNYKEGKKEGVWKEWYENGQLDEIINYKDGKRDGLRKVWYENGELEHKGNYDEGKKEGVWKYWYENGHLRKEQNYTKMKKKGKPKSQNLKILKIT